MTNTFRLPPSPAHATDAEISGLFRLLEQTEPSACECLESHDRRRAAFNRWSTAIAAELNR